METSYEASAGIQGRMMVTCPRTVAETNSRSRTCLMAPKDIEFNTLYLVTSSFSIF